MSNKVAPDRQTLERIIKSVPTPFHLYSEDIIRSRVRALRAAFSWNDSFREYYAVKACPTPAILKILKEEGGGVDCASECELMLAEAMGFSGNEIMFSSNETPNGEFDYAHRLGAIINLDDYTLVEALKNEGGVPESVCLRYNPGGRFMLGNSVMGNPGDAKFGMTRKQLTLSVNDLTRAGAKRFALHSFLASNTVDTEYYPTMARILMNVAKELRDETGAEFFMINLSGGIGIPYLPDCPETDIAQVGNGVKEAYDEILRPAGMHPIQIVSELGRYITGPAGWLITTAIHEKHTYKEYIGVDACAADLMRPAIYDAYHHITVAGKENAPCINKYDVVGSLCENNDKFAIDRMLPKIDMGDVLVIHDTGAHGRAMGYNYNGRLRSAEVLLKSNGDFELIRRAETPADYFATLDFTGALKNVLARPRKPA